MTGSKFWYFCNNSSVIFPVVGRNTFSTSIFQSQLNNLQHFPPYLDCQNNHFEVDLLGTSTFKPVPY